MSNFRPISKERAEEIRDALKSSRAGGAGIAIDKQTGSFRGASSLKNAADDRVNMISKYDTHYVN